MPDGMSIPLGADWFTKNRAWSELEQPTQTGPLMAPFTGNPQQMMAMLQHPQVQAQLKQFGINFDPSLVQQSPFFSNQFMGNHPHLGGAMQGALAGAAATPDAPPISGWGSGISRAIQGGMGGTDMLRQFQNRQLMAPMQMMGMQIPPMEFQRKQQFLGDIEKDLQSQMGVREFQQAIAEQMQALKQQGLDDKTAYERALNDLKAQAESDRATMTRPMPAMQGGVPGAYTYRPGGQGTQGQPEPSPNIPGMTNQQPGPPTQGGWGFEPGPNLFKPGAAQTKPRQGTPEQFAALEKQKQDMYAGVVKDFGTKYGGVDLRGQGKNAPKLNPSQQQEMYQRYQQIENWYAEAQRQLGGQSQGYTYPGQQGLPPQMMAPQAGGQQQQAGPQGQPSQGGFMPNGTHPPGAQVDGAGNFIYPDGSAYDPSGNFLGQVSQ